MLVKFLEPVEMRRGSGALEYAYGAGEVVELRADIARRWLNRNKAVRIHGDLGDGRHTNPIASVAEPDPPMPVETDGFRPAQEAFRTRELSGSPTPEATGSASPASGPEQPSASPRRDRRSMRRRSSGS
jgi:hypothetical protein